MAVTTFWSVKGGTGTSVVAAVAGILRARHGPTLLVDRAGDLPAVLGTEDPAGPGLGDWLASPESPPAALGRLEVPVAPHLALLPAGRPPVDAAVRRAALLEWLREDERDVVVDLGVPDPSEPDPPGRALLVVRPCYLALRRARRTTRRVDGIVLVLDAGRALDAADVTATLGRPVLTTVQVDPAVARTVDSGLLLRRPAGALGRAVRRLW